MVMYNRILHLLISKLLSCYDRKPKQPSVWLVRAGMCLPVRRSESGPLTHTCTHQVTPSNSASTLVFNVTTIHLFPSQEKQINPIKL